ncbi:MAG: hypothetical protein IT318_04210 [Anaerolineales bacterium]|nr:hypothetical protein [Anaerolineales bacterium]
MSMRLRWVLDADPGVEHCASCWHLAGQVHSEATWQQANLVPKSSRLMCWTGCKCSLELTHEPERGDLGAVPTRPEAGRDRPGPAFPVPLPVPEPETNPSEPSDPGRIPTLAPPARAGEPNPFQQEQTPMPDSNELRAQLSATGQVNAAGEFEIVAITAGQGNGWTFTAEALQASLGLWAGVETFVDHEGWFSSGRSVRDLAGVCHSPEWDAAGQGVRLQLRPVGPSGPLLAALGKEMLADTAHKPKVGFSADVIFTADSNKTVQTILRVLSLDLVFHPARGGAFIRALNSAGYRQENPMPQEQQDPRGGPGNNAPPANPHAAAQMAEDVQAMRALLDVQREQQALAAEAQAARAVRAEMCGYLLESGLAASRLPAPAQAMVRKRFAGQVFEPQALTDAIEEQRGLVAALTAGAVVQGPGRVGQMFNSGDQLQAAVDDLMEVQRDEPMKSAKVARLSGVRELYHLLTGDFDFHGGYYAERAALQHTTATFTGLVKNAMNKAVVERWGQLGRAGYDWWRRVVNVEHFETLNQITWTITGSIGTLPSVTEGGEYTELKIGDSPETSDFTKYGGYVGITLEALDRDDTRKLRQVPRELASAGIRRISGLVAAIFTDNSGVGPTLADTGALFNNTAVTTAGGHANLLTTALASAEWEVVSRAVYNQPLLVANETGYYGTGAKMAVNPRYLLVPRALQLTGMQILYPTLERATDIYSENLQRGEPGDVVTVPEWTDSTDWAAVVDPAIVPGICVGERFGLMPEIFVAGDELSPAVFMNDESRIKVRHFVAVGVADFRPLHKSNVAG